MPVYAQDDNRACCDRDQREDFHEGSREIDPKTPLKGDEGNGRDLEENPSAAKSIFENRIKQCYQ